MIIQKQPNRWSCLPTAAAMIVGIPVEELIQSIGHDGSEIIFHNLPDPYCRRSFHIQEIIDICLDNLFSITPIEFQPKSGIMDDSLQKLDDELRLTLEVGSVTIHQVVKYYALLRKYLNNIFILPIKNNRFDKYLSINGIFIGETINGKPHAVAWDAVTKKIYDPNGFIYEYSDFIVDTFWIIE